MLMAGTVLLIGLLQVGQSGLTAMTCRYVPSFMLCPHGVVTGVVNAS